jgi:hypothetical protein
MNPLVLSSHSAVVPVAESPSATVTIQSSLALIVDLFLGRANGSSDGT